MESLVCVERLWDVEIGGVGQLVVVEILERGVSEGIGEGLVGGGGLLGFSGEHGGRGVL